MRIILLNETTTTLFLPQRLSSANIPKFNSGCWSRELMDASFTTTAFHPLSVPFVGFLTCDSVLLYYWGTLCGINSVWKRPPPQKKKKKKKKSALVQLICFLSSSGGFQSGEVLPLCGSEVRALRLRRQTGEFQIKNVPAALLFFFLICIPSREPVDHPPRYTSLCLLPAKLSFTLRSPTGAVTHSSACTDKPTQELRPQLRPCARLHLCLLLFGSRRRALSLCGLNWNWLELKRLALMPGIIHRLDRARMGRLSWLPTENKLHHLHRTGAGLFVVFLPSPDWWIGAFSVSAAFCFRVLTLSHPQWGFLLPSKSKRTHWFLDLLANRFRLRITAAAEDVCVPPAVRSVITPGWKRILASSERCVSVYVRNIDYFLHISLRFPLVPLNWIPLLTHRSAWRQIGCAAQSTWQRRKRRGSLGI